MVNDLFMPVFIVSIAPWCSSDTESVLFTKASTQTASEASNTFCIWRLTFSFFRGILYNITLGRSLGRMFLEERPCGRNPSHPGQNRQGCHKPAKSRQLLANWKM